MSQTLTIRQETTADFSGIRTVVQAAFGRKGESDLVDGLRRSGALILSAVALSDDRIVGHVAFSSLTIDESRLALALAPVAVMPDCQRRGVGSALIRWSLEECQRLGHEVVIVLGDPSYYCRFGFTPCLEFGIVCPFPVPPEHFMVLELSPGAASRCLGTVRCPPEFESL
jgi:putative acetyltransferase